MRFSDVLENAHFQTLTAIVRVALRSPQWQREHREVSAPGHWKGIVDLGFGNTFEETKTEFVSRMVAFLAAITHADEDLAYTEDDLRWLVEMMDTPEANAVAGLFIAYAIAPDETVTPAEAAELTGTAESGWRNKAANGELPGAVKKGKQWLIPRRLVETE
jgi:hypothetical protein